MSDADREQAWDYIAAVREMIRHEDMLVNQRLTWMWTLQGLLFGATSILWGRSLAPVLVFGLVGLLSSLSIGYSIARGLGAIKELLGIASDYKKGLSDAIRLPPTIGARAKATEWLLPGYLLPWVFGVAWVAMILIRLLTAPAGG